MGNISLKADAPDTQTGLTPRQVKLVQSTWQTFCTSEREYGALLFSYMFAQQPELQELFPKFCDKPLRALKDDLLFRAHGCAVGYHLTSMVASLEDAAALKVLAWRNALKHLKRNGVLPDHFEVMGNCIVDAMREKDVRPMTAEVVKAWWKFTEYLVAVVKDVYEEAATQSADASSRVWTRAEEVALDTGSTTAATASGAHVGSSKKQPYAPQEPATEQTECSVAPKAANRPAAVKPNKDAAMASDCKSSHEKGTHEEAECRKGAHEKPEHQDVHSSHMCGKMAPHKGQTDELEDLVQQKEQAAT